MKAAKAFLLAAAVTGGVLSLTRPGAGEPEKKDPLEELIPFRKLDVPIRREVWQVTKGATIRRVVEDRSVACRLEVYRYLLDNLAIASAVVRQMRLGKYVITQREDGTFAVDDQEGAFANCEQVWEEEGRLVIIARGHVDPPLVSRVHGKGVTVISYRADEEDPARLSADCHIFFRLRNDFLHLVTRPFRRRLGGFLEDRFMGLVNCATRVAEAVQRDPFGVYQAMRDSEKVSREELDEFKRRFLLKRKF